MPPTTLSSTAETLGAPRIAPPTLAGQHIVVTGAAGFIGSHCVERLLSLGASVVGIDNFDPFYSAVAKRANLSAASVHPAFRLVEADCADAAGLERALANESVDAIIHLAAKAGVRPSIEDPFGYLQANVVATQAVLDVARRRGITRVVFGSSSSVYGNNAVVPFSEDQKTDRPVSPYAATKAAGELLCASYNSLYGTSIIALRFFTVYGPRQRPDLAIRKFATLMHKGAEIPVFGDGSTERDYTWVDDVIDGVIAALIRTRDVPGEYDVINLGGSRTTTLQRLIELLAEALHIQPKVLRLPMQPGDVLRTYADVRKAGRLLGYSPRVAIDVGIPRFAAWFISEGPGRRE